MSSLVDKGNEAAHSGDYPAAIQQFSEAIKLEPSDYRFYGNRSYCYDRIMQFDKWVIIMINQCYDRIDQCYDRIDWCVCVRRYYRYERGVVYKSKQDVELYCLLIRCVRVIVYIHVWDGTETVLLSVLDSGHGIFMYFVILFLVCGTMATKRESIDLWLTKTDCTNSWLDFSQFKYFCC